MKFISLALNIKVSEKKTVMWLTQYNYSTETSDLIRQYIVPYKHDIAKQCCKMINNVEECRKFRFDDELKL